MDLPTYDDLFPEQRAVYHHDPDEDLFAAGPPGSGKTVVAILRANYLRYRGRQVVLVTRNRMLKAQAQRLSEKAAENASTEHVSPGPQVQCMTMQSLMCSAFWNRFWEQAPKLLGSDYELDWTEILSRYDDSAVDPYCEHLIIDEGQNLPAAFFVWAKKYGGATLSVFADEDQTTERQSASLRQIFDAGLPQPHRLTFNHRNSPEIARVAEFFHQGALLAPATPTRTPVGDIPELRQIETWELLVDQAASRLRNHNEPIGIIVHRAHDCHTVADLLRERIPGARIDSYTSDSARNAEQDLNLSEPGVTILTSESVIGLEFDTVFLQDIRRSLPCTTKADYRRMYMLCARARDMLILVDGPVALEELQLKALPGPALLARSDGL